jgi:hypothetical protein
MTGITIAPLARHCGSCTLGDSEEAFGNVEMEKENGGKLNKSHC